MSSFYTTLTALPLSLSIPLTLTALLLLSILQNVLRQLCFPNPHRPPVVFHLFPLIGSTVQYGMDPYAFFESCRAKYGDVFTFILLGKPTTVFLGAKGNNFILNGKHADLNAEEVYGKLTTPVFGRGVIYDCPNERLMDQKRLMKEGFTTQAMRSYIPKFVQEVESYIATSPRFTDSGRRQSGTCNITEALSELTIYTASSSLQGAEVRSRFDATYAQLYRHLDDGFQPINFMLPWLPLPQNRRRDRARAVMEGLYGDIIRRRREQQQVRGGKEGSKGEDEEHDMIWTMMDAEYKDGTPVPDIHTARLMIALLMAGQHNTAASGAWIMLNLAHKPALIDELYAEQLAVLGDPLPPLTLEGLQKLKLAGQVIKETLRLHSPIHSIMRQVTRPLPIPDSPEGWIIPPSHVLLAAPGVLARSEEYFPHNPLEWDPHRWDATATTEEGEGEGEEEGKVNYGFGLVSKSARSPYLPFGAGRHRCLGEQYAYAQLGAIVATFVRLVAWEQVEPGKPVPATDYSSMFSRPMNPATIRWRSRKQ